MTSSKQNIELLHASSYAALSTDQFVKDLLFALNKAPDIATFTELGTRHPEFNSTCRDNGYEPVFATYGEGFAVKRDKNIKIKNKGAVKVSEGGQGYDAQYVSWVILDFYGFTVVHHVAHWLAHLQDGGGRAQKHQMMDKAVCQQVRKHGAGENVAFFAGDTNADKDDADATRRATYKMFRDNDLLTIWDEFHVYPNTHTGSSQGNQGRTIDVIGSYNLDKKVVGKSYKAYPMQNSDHRPIGAVYTIDGAAVKQSKDKGGKNTGHKGKDFVTGGKVDWSDYADTEVYDLPQAIDDSDGSNH